MISMRPSFSTSGGHLFRRLRRRMNEECVNIIAYHSIAPEPSVFIDDPKLCVHPDVFEAQVAYLSEFHVPMRLSTLVDAIEAGRSVERAVVITLDDGYADAISRAAPILRRRRIPMTIFPVTSVIGNTDLLWQHKLAWLLANRMGELIRDALQAAGFSDPPADASLRQYVRINYRSELALVLEAVLQCCGVTGRSLADRHRPYLELDDLSSADPELIEFGNHTHTHPIMSCISKEEQRAELATSFSQLMSLIGVAPVAVAYPFGLKRHYSADTRRLVKATGHRAALDMCRRINHGAVDPMNLSRKTSAVGTQEEFEKSIEDWPTNARWIGRK